MPGRSSARGAEDLPGWLRRSWLIPLVLGLLLSLFGVLLLANLGAGLRTLKWLIVVALVLAAVESFSTASLRHRPWMGWLVGALYVVGALVTVFWPGVTVEVLALTIGVSLLVAGAARAGLSWASRNTAQGWGWNLTAGIVSVVIGLVLLIANPIVSVLLVVVALACYIIFAGVTLVIISLAVRRLGRTVTAAIRR